MTDFIVLTMLLDKRSIVLFSGVGIQFTGAYVGYLVPQLRA